MYVFFKVNAMSSWCLGSITATQLLYGGYNLDSGYSRKFMAKFAVLPKIYIS